MYSLIIPSDLVKEMYNIRERFGTSIRKQILESVKTHIKNFRRFENESGIFTSADVWEHKQETQQHQGSDEPGNSGKVF